MITYNHEEFIREAMEGVLRQQTDCDIEFIISNDCSTDSTHETIEECINQYQGPFRIKYFNHEKNLGMQANFNYALNQTGGDYIALCEGDDYWTDPLKLQKQTDYISNHPDCKIVFTGVKVWNENSKEFLPNWANINREKYGFKNLLQENIITTCTVLFRNPHKNVEISNYLLNFKIGDFPLYLFLLRSGYAYFLNEVTAVYRQHSGGVFSLKDSSHMIHSNIELFEILIKVKEFSGRRFLIRKILIKWYYSKIVRMSNDLNSKRIRSYIIKKLKISDLFYNPVYFFRIIILFLFPKLKSNTFH